MLEESYVRTARAKGLGGWQLLRRHVVRNAMNPVLTAASGWFASMLAGAVFVEYVFGWNGMGLLMFRALEQGDLPVVMGGVLVVAAVFVAVNILVDVMYGWLDPGSGWIDLRVRGALCHTFLNPSRQLFCHGVEVAFGLVARHPFNASDGVGQEQFVGLQQRLRREGGFVDFDAVVQGGSDEDRTHDAPTHPSSGSGCTARRWTPQKGSSEKIR